MRNFPASSNVHGSADSGVVGVILARGQSLRMGQDKSQILWQGRSPLEWVTERIAPQVGTLLISRAYGTPATQDETPQQLLDSAPDLGPLGGIAAGLRWLQYHNHAPAWLLSCSCDAPLLPRQLVKRLQTEAAATASDVVYARCLGRAHYTHALWSSALLAPVEAYLAGGGRSLHGLLALLNSRAVDFDAAQGLDPFTNLNTPEDLSRLSLGGTPTP